MLVQWGCICKAPHAPAIPRFRMSPWKPGWSLPCLPSEGGGRGEASYTEVDGWEGWRTKDGMPHESVLVQTQKAIWACLFRASTPTFQFSINVQLCMTIRQRTFLIDYLHCIFKQIPYSDPVGEKKKGQLKYWRCPVMNTYVHLGHFF